MHALAALCEAESRADCPLLQQPNHPSPLPADIPVGGGSSLWAMWRVGAAGHRGPAIEKQAQQPCQAPAAEGSSASAALIVSSNVSSHDRPGPVRRGWRVHVGERWQVFVGDHELVAMCYMSQESRCGPRRALRAYRAAVLRLAVAGQLMADECPRGKCCRCLSASAEACSRGGKVA
jgi:hypothetical protein